MAESESLKKKLFDAVSFGRDQEVTDLLERGVNPDHYWDENTGFTSLIAACCFNRVECCRALIAHGVDLNTTDRKDNKTPLHFACHDDKRIECARLLLDHGCRIDLTDRCGKTALEIATENDSKEIIELLNRYRKV